MKIRREFFARPSDEQSALLRETWCDQCNEPDFGMHAPEEYEEEGRIYIEGRCNKCEAAVRTEVVDRETRR